MSQAALFEAQALQAAEQQQAQVVKQIKLMEAMSELRTKRQAELKLRLTQVCRKESVGDNNENLKVVL